MKQERNVLWIPICIARAVRQSGWPVSRIQGVRYEIRMKDIDDALTLKTEPPLITVEFPEKETLIFDDIALRYP